MEKEIGFIDQDIHQVLMDRGYKFYPSMGTATVLAQRCFGDVYINIEEHDMSLLMAQVGIGGSPRTYTAGVCAESGRGWFRYAFYSLSAEELLANLDYYEKTLAEISAHVDLAPKGE